MLGPGDDAVLDLPVQIYKTGVIASHLDHQVPVFIGLVLGSYQGL